MIRDRSLEIVRRLALLAPVLVGCSAPPTSAAPASAPVARPSSPELPTWSGVA